MAAFRAEYLAAWLGIEDPHATLFVSPGARRYAASKLVADGSFVRRTIARFQRFSERMASAAGRIEQFLVLGVGQDTRALWLPEIVANDVRVIEIVLPAAIERKVATLARNAIHYPDRVVPLGLDLASPDLERALADAGFDRSRPAAVFIEGVTFQLPPETIRHLLDPGGLGLASGSEVTFDYWTTDRVEQRNELRALSPMHRFALPEDPVELTTALAGLGYRDVSAIPLSALAARLWPDGGHDEKDWYLVEATVA